MDLCAYCGFEKGGTLCGTSNPEACAAALSEAQQKRQCDRERFGDPCASCDAVTVIDPGEDTPLDRAYRLQTFEDLVGREFWPGQS